MRKPSKPKGGDDAEARKDDEPVVRPEDYLEPEVLNEDLDGAGAGKPAPDHEDEL